MVQLDGRRKVVRWSPWTVTAWTILLIATAILVIMSGTAAGSRDRYPDTALHLFPNDARALANRGSNLLLGGKVDRVVVARARADALAALAQDPTLPKAWRTLGLTLADGSINSIRSLQTAQQLSRRDVPTQLALLELKVRQGDIVGALYHYDVILRVATTYDAVLFPVLAGAIAEPQIRLALSRRLLGAPMWRRRFFSYMANAGTPADTQAELFEAMARQGPLPDRDVIAAEATNSALNGQYAAAQRIYRSISPKDAVQPMRNGSFESDNGIPPFDWQLEPSDALDVSINPSSSGRRLEIVSDRGDGAPGARQLVSLSAGRHQLSARYGAVEGEAIGVPYIKLTCVSDSKLIGMFDGIGRDHVNGDVVIPAMCPLQWLEVGLRQNPSGTRVATWIDMMAVDGTVAR